MEIEKHLYVLWFFIYFYIITIFVFFIYYYFYLFSYFDLQVEHRPTLLHRCKRLAPPSRAKAHFGRSFIRSSARLRAAQSLVTATACHGGREGATADARLDVNMKEYDVNQKMKNEK